MDTCSEPEFIIESSSDEDNEDNEIVILSVDIGVLHLGISVSIVSEKYELKDIIWVDLIDITNIQHKRVKRSKCNLYHEKTFCDWLEHVFQENYEFFNEADVVLLERQPIMGFQVVEQLIFSKFRNKTILVSPNSMHRFFHIEIYDYDTRKIHVEKIAERYLQNMDLLQQYLENYERKHDIADSICLMIFWITNKNKEYIKEQRRIEAMNRRIYFDTKIKSGDITTEEHLESFRFIPIC